MKLESIVLVNTLKELRRHKKNRWAGLNGSQRHTCLLHCDTRAPSSFRERPGCEASWVQRWHASSSSRPSRFLLQFSLGNLIHSLSFIAESLSSPYSPSNFLFMAEKRKSGSGDHAVPSHSFSPSTVRLFRPRVPISPQYRRLFHSLQNTVTEKKKHVTV